LVGRAFEIVSIKSHKLNNDLVMTAVHGVPVMTGIGRGGHVVSSIVGNRGSKMMSGVVGNRGSVV